MAKLKEFSEGVASLTVDDSTARVGEQPLVRDGPGASDDEAEENVTLQPRQHLSQKYPTSLAVSANPETEVTGMYLTAGNKLWVKYKPPNTHVDYLKLFGDDGQELGLWRGHVIPEGSSLTCVVDDTLLSPQTWRWIKPSGESGRLDNVPNQWALCSKSVSPPYVILRDHGADAGAEVPVYSLHRVCVLSVDPLQASLVPVCVQGVTLEEEPIGFDVSTCGTVFCFVSHTAVEIFCTDDPLNSSAFTRLASCDGSSFELREYLTGRIGDPSLVITGDDLTFGDVCFCSERGRDYLIASTRYVYSYAESVYSDPQSPPTESTEVEVRRGDINILLELDHDDGFFVKRRIPVDRFCTCVNGHNPGGMVWLGGKGSKIQVEQLYSEL